MNRPAAVFKPGRDVTVGDVLPCGQGGFLILAFAEHWSYRSSRGLPGAARRTPPHSTWVPWSSCGCWPRPRRRMALNCWGEGIVVFDDRPTAVLQTEACRALSAENERLKATLAKVRELCDSTITFNDVIRDLVGAALDAPAAPEESAPETQRERDARLIIEADLADDRNDDAWLEDRGLL